MKKISLILMLLANISLSAQVKTLGKRKKPGAASTTVSGPVQQASKQSQVATVARNFPESKMRLKLPMTNSEREFTVKKVGNFYVLNDDIIVGDDIPRTLSYSISNNDYRWPGASMPLVIDASIYSNGKGGIVHEAIREFNERTKLCMVPRTTERDYVRITFSTELSGAGMSRIGKQGGEQQLFLAPSASKGTVLHELMHAAGFYHEQGREDRDNFIHIMYDNIKEESKNNFQKEGGTARGGYDFCSIMHYHGFAFAVDPTKPTIICINNIETCRNCIGQRDDFTGADLLGIDQFYSNVTRNPCKTIFPNPGVPQQFATVNIPESDKAMQSFRHRADYAAQNGFAAGFPNFHEARQGINIVGGTILIKHGMIAWQDVPLSRLGSPPMNDFMARMRATQYYALGNGYVAGFPNYHSADYGAGPVCGTFLLSNKAAEWREVPVSELGNPSLSDIGAMMRAANDYAFRNGYLGGYATFFNSSYGGVMHTTVVLIKKEAGEWRDVVIASGPR